MVQIVQFLIIANIVLYGVSILGCCANTDIMPFKASMMMTVMVIWAIYVRETSK